MSLSSLYSLCVPALNRNKVFLIAAFLISGGPLSGREPDASAGYRKGIQIEPLLRTTKDAAGQPLAYPVTENPQITAVRVEIPPGAETGWHRHPYPCFGYILSGALTVEIEGGKIHELTAGQALVEVVNLTHNGKNLGTEPVRLIMFVMGERDKPFTIPARP